MDNGINQDLPRISLLTVRVGPKKKESWKRKLKAQWETRAATLGISQGIPERYRMERIAWICTYDPHWAPAVKSNQISKFHRSLSLAYFLVDFSIVW